MTLTCREIGVSEIRIIENMFITHLIRIELHGRVIEDSTLEVRVIEVPRYITYAVPFRLYVGARIVLFPEGT